MKVLDPVTGLDYLPQPIAIITVGDPEKPGKRNAMTAAWVSRVSWNPPLVAVSIAPSRYTFELVKEFGEFAINLVSRNLLDLALAIFGAVSGRERDKFEAAGVTPHRARKILAPVLKEAPVVIECRVVKMVEAGDHVLVIGEVVEMYMNSDEKPVVWYGESARDLV